MFNVVCLYTKNFHGNCLVTAKRIFSSDAGGFVSKATQNIPLLPNWDVNIIAPGHPFGGVQHDLWASVYGLDSRTDPFLTKP